MNKSKIDYEEMFERLSLTISINVTEMMSRHIILLN